MKKAHTVQCAPSLLLTLEQTLQDQTGEPGHTEAGQAQERQEEDL